MEDFSLNKPAPAASISSQLKSMSNKELLELRNRVDLELGVEIKDLNLGEELGLLFRQGKQLLEDVLDDPEVPANQKAQVFNTVKGQVDKLVATRQVVFSQERLKRFEMALLKVVNMAGNEAMKAEFLDLYGSFLEDKGQ